MTKTSIRAQVVGERAAYIREMIRLIRKLPLDAFDRFTGDRRNIAAAESYLRRALESLFDLSRHILAKGFAQTPAEYEEIIRALVEQNILSNEEGRRMREIAGYRNRMVHFYHEITSREMFDICRSGLDDVEELLSTILRWLKENPAMLNRTLE